MLARAMIGTPTRERRLQFLALMGGFFAITLPLAALLDVSRDEWYSLRTTSRGLGYAFANAVGIEALPPAYPLLLDVWRGIHASIPFARCFSILIAAATLALAWRLAARHLQRLPPVWFASALAIAPFMLYSALDIRLYALAIFVSTALLVTFYEGFFDAPGSRRARIAHALLVAVCAYVQYYIAAQVLGEFVALLVLRRWKALRGFTAGSAIAALCWLPLLRIVLGQISVYEEGASPMSQVRGLVVAFTSFVFPNDWLVGRIHSPWLLLYAALGIACAVLLVLSRPRPNATIGAQTAIVATILAFFAITPFAIHQTLIFPRHAATLFVPALFLGALLLCSGTRPAPHAIVVTTVLYALGAIASFAITYASLSKEGDYRRVSMFLNENDPNGTPIYAFDLESVGPIYLYYRGKADLVPFPHPQSFDRFDPHDFVLTSSAQVRAGFARVGHGERVWMYLGPDCFDTTAAGDAHGCAYLRAVLASDFATLSTHDFHNSEVLELRRR